MRISSYPDNQKTTLIINDGTQYYFVKNLQGDVVQIRSIYGTVVVEYTYDAWGNVLSITGIYVDTLGVNNPIRYRGYYQDFETGFYYLESRYYDPKTGRFLNADGYVNANGDLIGYNLYAYCSNNPVMFVDPTGEGIWSSIKEFFKKLKNKDGSYSLYDNDRFKDENSWHEQFWVFTPSSKPSFNPKDVELE